MLFLLYQDTLLTTEVSNLNVPQTQNAKSVLYGKGALKDLCR